MRSELEQARGTRNTAALRSVRWFGIACLAAIGVTATIALIGFARKVAKDETYCFSGYYTAARLVLSSEVHGSLQNWDWFRAQTRRYGFKATDIFAGNPPAAALLMTPVASAQPKQARVVWTWLSLIFWFGGIGFAGASLFRFTGSAGIPVAVPGLLCLATLFEPFRANLAVGHICALMFLLQSAACFLWLSNRQVSAGVLAGTSLALKGYGIPLLLLGLFRRDWRFTAAGAGAFSVLALAAGSLTGFRQWTDFLGSYTDPMLTGMATPALQTLKSYLILALHVPVVTKGSLQLAAPAADHFLAGAEMLVLVALIWWLSRAKTGPETSPSYAALAACVVLNLVFAPRAEDYTYTLVMTALLLLLPELRRMDLAAAGLILGSFLLSWPFHFKDRTILTSWNLLSDFPRLYGAFILLAVALATEQRSRRKVSVPKGAWGGAWVACVLGIVLVLWYAKPFRDPVSSGPLLAVSRDDNSVTLVRLDLDEREVKTIPVSCKGPFGVAFAPRRDWLYAACTDESKVSLIDLRRRREYGSFLSSRFPAWAQQRTRSSETWISNEATKSISIFRTGTSEVIGEIATDAGPSDIAFTNDGRRAWVTNEASGTVWLIDADRRAKIGEVTVGAIPQGIALTSTGDKLVVANFRSNTLSVIDTGTVRELVQIPVCQGPVDVITTRRHARELAFVSCFGSGAVGVIDLGGRRQIGQVGVGEKPLGIAVHPDGGRVYVCLSGSPQVVVVDTAMPNRVLRRIELRAKPLQIGVAPH